jgi:hypothetical protein
VVDGLLVRLEQIIADDQQAWLRLRSSEPQPTTPAQEAGTAPRES